MNLEKYLQKTFDRQHYNCWTFAREVWLDIAGVDIESVLCPSVEDTVQRFEELSAPESPCLVLFERAHLEPHVGVYYRGKVLHINERGAEYRDLNSVSASWTKVRYYR